MADDYRYERSDPTFWQRLGLDDDAAAIAAGCFPEAWAEDPYTIRTHNPPDFMKKLPSDITKGYMMTRQRKGLTDEDCANNWIWKYRSRYITEAWHPVYWHAQGCDFDEMARRAVMANAMLNLSQSASTPPKQPDLMPDALLALMSQSQTQLPPPRQEDFVNDLPVGQEQDDYEDSVSRTRPFDSGDFPRINL